MTTEWSAGTPIEGPVYLDANVVVAYLVRGHQFYGKAFSLMGDLLSAGSPILLSDLSVIESIWGLTSIALGELKQWPASKRFDPTTYRRDHQELFTKRGATVGSFAAWLEQLGDTGYPIEVVHHSRREWVSKATLMISYMQAFGLIGQDAAHLSIATGKAKSFVTCDRAFEVVNGERAPVGLQVVLIRPDSPVEPIPVGHRSGGRRDLPKRQKKPPRGKR